MTLLPSNIKVHLAVGSTDMRKSINGLGAIVMDDFKLDPFSGHLFAFCSRSRKIIKILFWDQNGFCIWHKRLEKERFNWPESAEEVIRIDSHQMSWLLSGLDIKMAHKRLNYTEL